MVRAIYAKRAVFDRTLNQIAIRLSDDSIFRLDTSKIQGLAGATPDQIDAIELSPAGVTIQWPMLGVDHLVSALVAGVYGNSSWMADLDRSPDRH